MINYDMIVKLAASMKKEYTGFSPEMIIRMEGPQVLRYSMGNHPGALKGFIQKNNRCCTVVVNADLPGDIQNKILFHELGHFKLGHTLFAIDLVDGGHCVLHCDRAGNGVGGVVGILLGSAEQHEHSVAEKADDCAVIFLDDRDHFFKILIEHGDKLCRGELGG